MVHKFFPLSHEAAVSYVCAFTHVLSRRHCYNEFTQNKELLQLNLLRKKLTHILSFSENHLVTAASKMLPVCLDKSESRLIYSKLGVVSTQYVGLIREA